MTEEDFKPDFELRIVCNQCSKYLEMKILRDVLPVTQLEMSRWAEEHAHA